MLTLTHFENLTDQTQGTWINTIDPTPEEKQQLLTQTGIPEDFLTYGLDPDEGGRYEYDDDSSTGLVIFDAPVAQDDPDLPTYTTVPLTVIMTGNGFVTMIDDQNILTKIQAMLAQPTNANAVLLQILYDLSRNYLPPLRAINKERITLARRLQSDLRNRDLYAMMGIQQSLVYFKLSLKTNRDVLTNLKQANALNFDDDAIDQLDDILIETQQATEMTEITDAILHETTDTYNAVINNNLNDVMKVLTLYSIVLTIPGIVFGFFGMNVHFPFTQDHWGWLITIGIAILLSALIAVRLNHRQFFRK
ncbi:magnesium transporter CorA family protein [Lacticaseibacillus porcinae]|uniref:magnesium transporter CorA family protein n=1 Tax=Lacticaseibacillus porcinae TaxID=1123687 RepID=UPI000F787915|nr:magnesium transporter CorA family protein [Lacticaseibacillus porcinae]